MKKKIILTSIITFGFLASSAQTDVDALRYSGSSITGTARFSALSGAFGALGGDFTSLSFNPAGIAIYRSSEFTFTPSIYVGKTTTDFLGNKNDERKYNFNLGNVGLVFTRILSENAQSEGWKSWNFGIGYNRLHNFHNRSFYQGTNSSNSLVDNFLENSNGLSPDQLDGFYENLAFNTYLTDTIDLTNYYGAIPSGQEIQRRSLETRGSLGETVFSFGANYSNKFYFGATLGLKNLKYISESIYEERDPDTLIQYFENLKFEENVTTEGDGIDFKIGMIYRPNDFVRIGAAIHTPTWYSLHDDFKNLMSTKFDTTGAAYDAESPDGAFDYELTTPFKAIGSIAFIFNNYGLLSADYEFSDFSETRFDASGATFSDVNNLIRTKYGEVHTLRVGTEWIYQNLSFRGGASFSTSPIREAFRVRGTDYSTSSYSGGIGYREKNFFLDFGYVYRSTTEFYQPYTLQARDVPGVNSDVVSHNFVITLGAKF